MKINGDCFCIMEYTKICNMENAYVWFKIACVVITRSLHQDLLCPCQGFSQSTMEELIFETEGNSP